MKQGSRDEGRRVQGEVSWSRRSHERICSGHGRPGRPTRTEQVLTACRLRTLKGIGSTTSTSCGIVWRRAATCRHRSSESISRRAMARPAPWVFFHCVGSYRPDGGQAGPGAEVGETLPPGLLWVPGQTSPRIRHWHRPGSAASNMTGSSTSILRGSSTISTIRCC